MAAGDRVAASNSTTVERHKNLVVIGKVFREAAWLAGLNYLASTFCLVRLGGSR